MGGWLVMMNGSLDRWMEQGKDVANKGNETENYLPAQNQSGSEEFGHVNGSTHNMPNIDRFRSDIRSLHHIITSGGSKLMNSSNALCIGGWTSYHSPQVDGSLAHVDVFL